MPGESGLEIPLLPGAGGLPAMQLVNETIYTSNAWSQKLYTDHDFAFGWNWVPSFPYVAGICGGDIKVVLPPCRVLHFSYQSNLGAYVLAYETGSDGWERTLSATMRRQVGDDPWQDLRQRLFSYYEGGPPPCCPASSSSSSSSSSGSAALPGATGDLESVTRQVYVDGNWTGDRLFYYRYSVGGEAAHRVKYALEPDHYEQLAADPGVSDPAEASEQQVAQVSRGVLGV